MRVMSVAITMKSAALVAAVRAESIPRNMRCALLVENEAKRLLSIGGGKPHRPSAPGVPPHLEHGDLRNSISSAATPIGTAVVGPVVEYGAYQEFGTRDGKLKKRPFMRPALMSVKHLFPKQYGNLKLKRLMPAAPHD